MSDAEVSGAGAAAPSSPKKAKGKAAGGASKKPRVKPTHPKTSDMVNAAIKDLKERGGSSLQAIKKYISSNYKVDAEKMAPFIRKYLKSAVTSGSLVQTKGKGASGSFKLAGAAPSEKTATKVTKPKPKAPKPKSSPKAKKSKAAVKKPAASPKKATAAAKKPPATPKKAAAKPKTGGKVKTAAKSPTKKPKAPKPKKATAAKAKTPKKAAPKKK